MIKPMNLNHPLQTLELFWSLIVNVILNSTYSDITGILSQPCSNHSYDCLVSTNHRGSLANIVIIDNARQIDRMRKCPWLLNRPCVISTIPSLFHSSGASHSKLEPGCPKCRESGWDLWELFPKSIDSNLFC